MHHRIDYILSVTDKKNETILRVEIMTVQRFKCPNCGEITIPVHTTKRLDWTTVDEFWCCALCGARIDVSSDGEDSASSGESSSDVAPRAVSRLAGFLGETDDVISANATNPLDDGSELWFCRDCRHFLKHPFICRCLYHGRTTEPMKHCENFERIESEHKSTDEARPNENA